MKRVVLWWGRHPVISDLPWVIALAVAHFVLLALIPR
jgi:hypothetical protein